MGQQTSYPVNMRKGVIQVLDRVVVVVVDTKNLSGDLGTRTSCNHNEFGEKLASVCSESNGTAYKHHKYIVSAF